MKFSFLFFIFLLSGISQSYACKCVGDIVVNFPENHNYNDQVETAGWGYLVDDGVTKKFKFLACYNRPGCKDLVLPKGRRDEVFLIKNPVMNKIQSFFKTFEDGLEDDKKKNIISAKEREIRNTKKKSYMDDWCSCPVPDNDSIITDRRGFKYSTVRTALDIKKEKISVPNEMKGCGCEEIVSNQGYGSKEIAEKYKDNGNAYKGGHKMVGFFYEKEGKLFFKELKGKDFEFYHAHEPHLKRKIYLEEYSEDDLEDYKESKKLFFKELEKIEANSIEIKKKYKCNPILSSLLKERLVIRSEKSFGKIKNVIQDMNLCHMTMENYWYTDATDIKH